MLESLFTEFSFQHINKHLLLLKLLIKYVFIKLFFVDYYKNSVIIIILKISRCSFRFLFL